MKTLQASPAWIHDGMENGEITLVVGSVAPAVSCEAACVENDPVRSARAEPRPHGVDGPSRRGHHADDDQRAPIHDCLAIDEHPVLAVVAPNRVHLDSEFTTEPRRHPDGMDARHSERAIANRDPRHRTSSLG